jgi:hypothetical protein
VRSKSLKLNPNLWARVERCAKLAGYSSPEELVEHVLERELARLEDSQPDEEILRRLKGLGYIK